MRDVLVTHESSYVCEALMSRAGTHTHESSHMYEAQTHTHEFSRVCEAQTHTHESHWDSHS